MLDEINRREFLYSLGEYAAELGIGLSAIANWGASSALSAKNEECLNDSGTVLEPQSDNYGGVTESSPHHPECFVASESYEKLYEEDSI